MYYFLRRCPLLPVKVKARRLLRVSKGVSHQILKNQKSYYSKATEIFWNQESPEVPFWNQFNNAYLFDEIILFLLFPEDIDDILPKKISIRSLTKVCDFILHRFVIPFLIHQFIELLHFIWKQNPSV